MRIKNTKPKIDITLAIFRKLRDQAWAEEQGFSSIIDQAYCLHINPPLTNCRAFVYNIYNAYTLYDSFARSEVAFMTNSEAKKFLNLSFKKIRSPQIPSIICFKKHDTIVHMGTYLGKNKDKDLVIFQQLATGRGYKITSLKELLGEYNYGKVIEFYESSLYKHTISQTTDYFVNNRDTSSTFWDNACHSYNVNKKLKDLFGWQPAASSHKGAIKVSVHKGPASHS
ncbi:MAG: hypothetical protein JW841_09330 [Deltaproteobacteria bacterium]|nr:hypothetical protein [Deltaproteobacteria bacterium]